MSKSEPDEKADAVQAGSPEKQEPPDADRREAVKKLGKFAVCTAPVMLGLLLPKKSTAAMTSPTSPSADAD